MEHRIAGIDHVAITATDLEASCRFYIELLEGELLFDHVVDGVPLVRGIRAGGAMLSIHQAGNGIPLVARHPTIGATDVCFRWTGTIDDAVAHLGCHGVPIEEGPVNRFANDGTPAQSVYFRDPDGNLLELLTTTV